MCSVISVVNSRNSILFLFFPVLASRWLLGYSGMEVPNCCYMLILLNALLLPYAASDKQGCGGGFEALGGKFDIFKCIFE